MQNYKLNLQGDVSKCQHLFNLKFFYTTSNDTIDGYLLCPSTLITLTPLNMKNICDIPLSNYLLNTMKNNTLELQVLSFNLKIN